MTHICVGNQAIIGPDNGLSPGRRQTIIWTNAGMLLIGPCGTNFSEILIGIQTFSFKKMHLKMSSAKCRLFCLGLNVLKSKIRLLTHTLFSKVGSLYFFHLMTSSWNWKCQICQTRFFGSRYIFLYINEQNLSVSNVLCWNNFILKVTIKVSSHFILLPGYLCGEGVPFTKIVYQGYR